MKYNYKKDKIEIIKKAINLDLANFIYNYFLIKRQVAQTMFETKYISSLTEDYGHWRDKQVPNTYSHYADIGMETLLLLVQPTLEKVVKHKLIPNYSYARIYKQGDVLERHKDRFSCEVSTTMNLGGDNWPIYLDPTNTHIPREDEPYKVIGNKGTKINLNPGDMLIYSGCALEHWREKFTGNECAQVFLHYNDSKTKGSKKNMFDTRPHLGLPEDFKKDYPWK